MKIEIYKQEKKQTLVFDINEIYRVIPEANELEGKNFSTIKQLLKELIAKVEESGQWEFVQYVNEDSPNLSTDPNIIRVKVIKPDENG